MTTDTIAYLPLDLLHPCPAHPVKLRDDNAMRELIESVRTRGIIHPIIVRSAEYGYEIIDGRRRVKACTVAGMETVPAIVRELVDDQAIIDLIDSCIQREEILPSERAAAYRMKLEAIKRQGARHDLTSRQVFGKLETADLIADNESGRQVQRYIRLTELIPEILTLVDSSKIALTPAVELSYLTQQEQRDLLETMESEDCTPSLSQAIQLKKLSQAGELNIDKIFEILREPKANQQDKISFRTTDLKKYFPKSYDAARIQAHIIKLMEADYRKRQRVQSR